MHSKARKKRALTYSQKIKLEHLAFTKIEGFLPILRYHAHELWRQLWIAGDHRNNHHVLIVGKATDIKEDIQRLTNLFANYLRPPEPKTKHKDTDHYYIVRVSKGEQKRIKKQFKLDNDELKLKEKWDKIQWDNPKERKQALERMKWFLDHGATELHEAFLRKLLEDEKDK